MSASPRVDPLCDERIARLREEVMARRGSWVEGVNPLLRDAALWRAWRPGLSFVQIRAYLLRELVRLAPVSIGPGWSLAGEHLGGYWEERIAGHQFLASHEGLADAHWTGFDMEPADRDAVIALEQRLFADMRSSDLYAVGEPHPEGEAGHGGWGGFLVHMSRGWMENHSVRDYPKLLRIGFGGLRDEIRSRLDAADLADPAFPQKENFWRAALAVCEAGILLGKRYAEEARASAASARSDAEGKRLSIMAEACERVPERGARTFFEAVQALWFGHILTCGEDGINANSIGRLDRMLQPYYDADLAAGRIRREDAVALMEELACKLYLDYDVQAITLGGAAPDGSPAYGEMTSIVLEATRNVGFIRDVALRLREDTPREILRLSAEMVRDGGGIPFFFNDHCFVDALVHRGIAPGDAHDYAPIGCIELTVPGKANPHAVSGWISAIKCLELALFDGEDPVSGKRIGPRTGTLENHPDFDSFYDAYSKQLDYFTRRMVYICNRGELMQRERGPLPCWSVLTDDCIARGRDITDGGAVYNYHSICFMGNANTADSLMAIRKLVFEEKRIAKGELLRALRADFEGYEDLRQKLLHGAPKYGNDQPEVDALAARVAQDFIDHLDTYHSPLDGRYFAHLFTFRVNIQAGASLGATPDGRRAGEPIAYSLSAQQGRDEKGITAMLASLSRLPHGDAAGASAAIVDVDPKLVEGEAGLDLLVRVLESAVRMRVGQLQMNVTTAERLRQAQADPERYGNIPVRVAGYSQMFRLLDKDLQEHVIARTKHEG